MTTQDTSPCPMSTLLCDSVVEFVESLGELVAEGRIVLLTTQTLVVAAGLLGEGGYVGRVDLAIHVDGLRSAVSWEHFGPGVHATRTRHPYSEEVYRGYERVDAATLESDPLGVAEALVCPLTRVTAGEAWGPTGPIRP